MASHVNITIRQSMLSRNREKIIYVALIIALGALVYVNSLGGDFIWDDIAFIRDNQLIQSWSNAPRVFSQDVAKSLAPGGGGVRYNFYRPLQILTYMLDYSVWGLKPFGYRLTNLIFHILAALALFWLLLVLFENQLFAFLASAFFVVHPVHTEAVAFISGRADPMALFFMLLTFVFYVRIEKGDSPHSGTVPFFYTLALLSRESSVILPLLILLYSYFYKKSVKNIRYISLAIITLAYVVFRSSMATSLLGGVNTPSFAGAFGRVPGFFAAFVNYIRILFLPFELHMEYGNPLFEFTNSKVILGGILFALLAVYAIIKRKEARFVSFSIFWFILSLLPSSNIYPIGAYMAEHWLYVPSIGFFLLLAKGIMSLHSYRIGVLVTVSLLAFYSFVTVHQTDYWKELIPFYERTLKYNPDSPRLLNNMGVAYHDKGENEKAIEAYRKAIDLDPRYFETFCNLGTVYHDIKEYKKAEEMYKREIAINPAYPKVYNNLGALYNDSGEYGKAVLAYRKAIELRPDQMEIHFNLGLAYQHASKYKESITAYKRAIELKPDYPNAYNDLGVSYHKSGKPERAVEAYGKALELDPDNTVIQNNLNMVLELLLNGKK